MCIANNDFGIVLNVIGSLVYVALFFFNIVQNITG